MEVNNSNIISSDSIKTILTLRYNSEIVPVLPKLTTKDFSTIIHESSTEFIKKSISNEIKNSIQEKCENVTIALSGGIDSTLILAILRETFPNLQISAVSMKFAESVDETQQASRIAKHFGAQHQIISLDNFLIELPKAISITKQPFWDLHWYHIVKHAKTNGAYLVSGDGGDELFGGYTFRYQKFLSLVNSNSSSIERTKAYLQCHERDWVEDQEDLFGNKVKFSWNFIHKKLLPYFDNSLSLLQQVFLADYNGKLLYNFNPINTSLHNGFSMNSVTPLLSTEIIEHATHLKTSLKYNEKNNVGKLPLRKLLENYIDFELLTQTKQGFSINTVNLWKSYGYKLCGDYLNDARIVKEGWINSSWIEKNLKTELDVKYINKFLGLLAFEIWYRLFVTSEMDSNTLLE